MFDCSKKKTQEIVEYYGKDILTSPGMQSEKKFIQHGVFSVYDHSVKVARVCVGIANFFHLKTDNRALVRGALLHDYFLYDWHLTSPENGLHGFTHAACALENAKKDFVLSKKEENMILAHMFPLNLTLPKSRESVILCISDKICATYETLHGFYKKIFGKRRK